MRYLQILFKNIIAIFGAIIIICTLLALVPEANSQSFLTRLWSNILTIVFFEYDVSLNRGVDIYPLVIDASKKTFTLVFLTIIVTILVTVPAAYKSACNSKGIISSSITNTINLLSAVPVLIWATLLLFFAFILFNQVPIYADLENSSFFLSFFVIALPVTSLIFGDGMLVDIYNRIRQDIAELLQEPWIKGLKSRGIQLKYHLLRGLVLPIFNAISSKIAYLISGTIIVEYIFSWQGLGFLIWDALITSGPKDYPLILACIKILFLLILFFSIVRDIIAFKLNPQNCKH